MKNNKFVAAVLIPIFALMFVFLLLPILLGLRISLMDYNPLSAHNSFVWLDNFKKLITDDVFKIALKNTLVFVGVTVTLNIIITLFIAQIISTIKNNKLRSALRVVFFMPCVAPLAASSVVWGAMYNVKYGLINNILKNVFNIPPHNWLGSAATLMPAIIIFTLWADIGYNIIIFSAGIDGISPDFYEAAEIDGANGFSKFFFITLPLLARTTSFVITMTLISHLQMFAQFAILTHSGGGSGGPNNAGMVLTLEIYKTAFKQNNMGYASAIAFVLFIIIMIFTVISRRLNRVDWGY